MSCQDAWLLVRGVAVEMYAWIRENVVFHPVAAVSSLYGLGLYAERSRVCDEAGQNSWTAITLRAVFGPIIFRVTINLKRGHAERHGQHEFDPELDD